MTNEERFDSAKRAELDEAIIWIMQHQGLNSGEATILLELLDYIGLYRPDAAAFHCCFIIARYCISKPIVYKKALKTMEKLLPYLIYQQFHSLQNFVNLANIHPDPELRTQLLEKTLTNLLDDPRPVNDIGGLLYTTSLISYPRLRQVALNQLERVKEQHIREIAQWWVRYRDPAVEEMLLTLPWSEADLDPIWKNQLAIKTGQFDKVNQTFQNAIYHIITLCSDPDLALVNNTLAFLRTVDETHLNEIATRWARERTTGLLKILVERNYLPTHQTLRRERVLLALKQGKNPIIDSAIPLLPYLLECLSSGDYEIAKHARYVLLHLDEQEAREALCEMVINENMPAIEEIVLEAGYLPADLNQRALFYFITEQWEAYETLDFDQSRLKVAYHKAESQLQRYIGQLIRKTGKVDYLGVINQGDLLRPASFNGKESNVLVQVLERNGEWPQLWRLLTELPVRLSWQVVGKMREAGWQPASAVEQNFLKELQTLQEKPAELDVKTIRHSLKPGQRQALNWAAFIAIPLTEIKPSDLAELLAFRANTAELPAPVENALNFAEAVLRYRFRHTVELTEATDIPAAEFDIELGVSS